jgi:uncharacterized protein (TIGR04255 family)
MSKKYKKTYVKKVIARIDFSTKQDGFDKDLPEKIKTKLLESFPILEMKDFFKKEIQLSETEAKENVTKIIHYFFNDMNRTKVICITTDFAYLEYNAYKTFSVFNDDFICLLDTLGMVDYKIKINRFGLRFINTIEISDLEDSLSWDKYIDSKLLCSLDIPSIKKAIIRSFHNLVLRFDDEMQLLYQFGVPNPDFPAFLRAKQFILDFDAYRQSLQSLEEIKTDINLFHDRIEELFERSITQNLRVRMEEYE